MAIFHAKIIVQTATDRLCHEVQGACKIASSGVLAGLGMLLSSFLSHVSC
jgi:hypothetical protein